MLKSLRNTISLFIFGWLFFMHNVDVAMARQAGDLPEKYNIHHAAFNGDEEAVLEYLEQGIDINTTEGTLGDHKTPLHFAAESGQVGMIKFLVKMGANVNAHQNQGTTPLLLAVRGEHEGAIRCLIELGARPLELSSYVLAWKNPYNQAPNEYIKDVIRQASDKMGIQLPL